MEMDKHFNGRSQAMAKRAEGVADGFAFCLMMILGGGIMLPPLNSAELFHARSLA
jgi:hypothetical protein